MKSQTQQPTDLNFKLMYRRFLNDKDYLAIITKDGLNQLLREEHDRILQAEESAEQDMREFLDQYYEIEKVLAQGKSIREYSPMVTYPADAYFYVKTENSKGDIVLQIARSLTSINAYHKPTLKVYWERVLNFDGIDTDKVIPYFQMRTYRPGDIVKYGTEFWRCVLCNGWDFNNIVIPGLNAWKEVPVRAWEPLFEWVLNDVCSYDGVFYALISEDGLDTSQTPDESNCWGEIGEYTTDYEYSYGEDSHDYVVCEGSVFLPFINPNADKLEENVNYVFDDPRNPNVVKHMTRIAIYYLHQTISPTNIPQSRQYMYEESKDWLYKASKFKLNPQLPRKMDPVTKEPKVDWALADFSAPYDTDTNPWLM